VRSDRYNHWADFGVRPNSRQNAVVGVQKALEACHQVKGAILACPKGRHDFWPEQSAKIEYYESNTTSRNPQVCPVARKGFKGLTIEGNGSEFVCHGRMQPLTLEDCEGVTARNLSIGWDIPFVAQAKIEKVEKDYIDIRINRAELGAWAARTNRSGLARADETRSRAKPVGSRPYT